jgi:hypothetical protein
VSSFARVIAHTPRKTSMPPSYDLDSFFSKEGLISYVDNLVGGCSSSMAKSKVGNISYSVEVLEEHMHDVIEDLKLLLVGKFLTFFSNIDQVRKWVDSI